MENRFFLFLILILNLTQLRAQESSCPDVKFGYLINYYQKPLANTNTCSDYYFFEKLPNLDSIKNSSYFLLNGGRLVDIEYYLSSNLNLSISEDIDLLSFQSIKYKVKKIPKSKTYLVVYKTVMSFIEKETPLNDYLQRNNQAHTHSYLDNNTDKSKNLKVIYPILISSFN